MMQEWFVVHPEIETALADSQPVVALESTVITHGLPAPTNLETAQAMEEAVRRAGAIPATIAIIEGKICIGLSADQLSYLAALPGPAVRKCSRRDLPLVVARRENGATTVAGTMILAHLAGIPVFATGGIGGVHRGHAFDISADLTELGRTPVTVVCSGPKAILDLSATREVLETNGVPVIGYETDEMPAFYTAQSGFGVDSRVDTPVEVAHIIQMRNEMSLASGILVTVPVPAGAAGDPGLMESAIITATAEADAQGIHGPAATPWLLERVATLTAGQSLRANQALLANNARIAGMISVALSSGNMAKNQA
jgi:pseudouridine-5'-phosphate glycosidase